MYSSKVFDGIDRLVMISIFVLFPLAVWKVIDIIIWLSNNLDISIGLK